MSGRSPLRDPRVSCSRPRIAGSVVLVAIDWRQIGREQFDGAVERLLKAKWDAEPGASAFSPDGRGGDSGIDSANKRNLPLCGSMSVQGHVDQLKGWQRGLRTALYGFALGGESRLQRLQRRMERPLAHHVTQVEFG